MSDKFLRTYKFYDAKKRRLSIFATLREDSKNLLDVYVIPCSKQDQFDKKRVKELFDLYMNKNLSKLNLERFVIPVIDEKTGQSFIKWCREKFYQKSYKDYVASEVVYLIKSKQTENAG